MLRLCSVGLCWAACAAALAAATPSQAEALPGSLTQLEGSTSWQESDWLGLLYADEAWLFLSELNYAWAYRESGGVWLYNAGGLGWLWTHPAYYPEVYWAEHDLWLVRESVGPYRQVFRTAESGQPVHVFSSEAQMQTDFQPQVRVMPIYPSHLRPMSAMGQATVAFSVDARGRPRELIVAASDQPEFGEAALQALEHWVYPQGQPKALHTETLHFRP